MLFTCLPEGAQIPGRFPGPAHARGKWFTIDIHCHLLTVKAEEMVQSAGLSMDWQPRHQFANELTRETNREQAPAHPRAVHRHPDPARRHGPHGDRHPGDHPVAGPDLLQRAARSRHRHRAGHQRQYRRDLRQSSGPLRRARHGAVPGARAGGRRTRPAAQIARAARHRDRDQRRRRRSVGAALPADLRARRGAGARPVHAPDRVSRGQPLPRPLLHEHHRQPARYDRRGASPDLRRRLAGSSEPEARAVAWRRLSAGLFRAHRPRRLGPARYLHLHPAHADDLSEAALFRHDRLHAPAASVSRRPVRRRSHPDGHRLSGRHGRDRPDRVCRGRAGARRCRAPRDPRRQRRPAAQYRNAAAHQGAS